MAPPPPEMEPGEDIDIAEGDMPLEGEEEETPFFLSTWFLALVGVLGLGAVAAFLWLRMAGGGDDDEEDDEDDEEEEDDEEDDDDDLDIEDEEDDIVVEETS